MIVGGVAIMQFHTISLFLKKISANEQFPTYDFPTYDLPTYDLPTYDFPTYDFPTYD